RGVRGFGVAGRGGSRSSPVLRESRCSAAAPVGGVRRRPVEPAGLRDSRGAASIRGVLALRTRRFRPDRVCRVAVAGLLMTENEAAHNFVDGDLAHDLPTGASDLSLELPTVQKDPERRPTVRIPTLDTSWVSGDA